jgi:hypothetical protein
VDNAVLRADVGTGVVQNSSIIIDDETTSTQNNVAIRNNDSQTNSALVLTPKGTGALLASKPNGAASGGNARGANAVDWQTVRSASNQVASGSTSVIGGGLNNRATSQNAVIAGGYQNFVSGGNGDGACCGGQFNQVTAQGSFIGGGCGNTASGESSVVCGGGLYNGVNQGNTASGNYSAVLGGVFATANRYSMQAHAAGRFSDSGDAQRARFVLRNKTTNATATELFLDGASVRLTIPSGKVLGLTINITGIKSDGTAVAHYLRQYALKNVAGTTSQVYAPVTIGTDNAAGTTIALSANDTNDALKVEVTGITSEIWRWVASVDAVEIAYGT